VKIYLAGGMHSDWRKEVRRQVSSIGPSITFIDPSAHEMHLPQAYTAWDLRGVSESDLVFAYMEKDNPGGQGLMLEMGFALGQHKPVIFVDESENRYFLIGHFAATAAFASFADGIDFLFNYARLIYDS
jgi:nucleoside 2-deoxyribosyltransferase